MTRLGKSYDKDASQMVFCRAKSILPSFVTDRDPFDRRQHLFELCGRVLAMDYASVQSPDMGWNSTTDHSEWWVSEYVN